MPRVFFSPYLCYTIVYFQKIHRIERGLTYESTYRTQPERRRPAGAELEPGAYPPALVLANFKEKDLDTLLDLMKQAQVNILLKAVVTPSNKNWVFGDLLAHLSEEHASFTAAAKEQA